jgi:hypothetical protein
MALDADSFLDILGVMYVDERSSPTRAPNYYLKMRQNDTFSGQNRVKIDQNDHFPLPLKQRLGGRHPLPPIRYATNGRNSKQQATQQQCET